MKKLNRRTFTFPSLWVAILALIPVFTALAVWFSSLSFVPVPWPDDSAFYFVAKELFKWPPRWVMLPQAPFEPTYQIFNFNTMPLYPILIGLGRWIGIDGSFLLKFWPLSGWAFSGSLLAVVLYRKKLPFLFCLVIALLFSFDPELRWASVLVRPESLIGLFGIALVLGLTFGFPKKFQPTRFWDPVAGLLVIAAYAHFNAVHLVIPVLFAYALNPKRLIQIGWKSTLYLSPWIFAVFYHWKLFLGQMETQWGRLNIPNGWLNSWGHAVSGIFQDLGDPIPWTYPLNVASSGMLILLLIALGTGLVSIASRVSRILGTRTQKTQAQPKIQAFQVMDPSPSLLPAFGWLLGSIWIWHSKPEAWFVYYLHISLWCFVGVALFKLVQLKNNTFRTGVLAFSFLFLFSISGIFAFVNVRQALDLSATQSWHWPVYYDFVDCIDQRLTQLEKNLRNRSTGKAGQAANKPFRVWDPTFPDVTIELSRKHPHWEFTRTNDFMNRVDLALQHGWNTEAVVVTETLGWAEKTVSAPMNQVPEITSIWMLWKPYFLNRLWSTPGWKPNRYICQRGRWQAFLFMEEELLTHVATPTH